MKWQWRVFTGAVVVAASAAGASQASALDYSGKYKSKVVAADGFTNKATVTIKKIDERVYTAESKYDGFVEVSICFAEDDRLSCGFGPKSSSEGHYIGVTIYRPGEKGKLIGEWVETSTKRVGKEVLTPADK